MVGDDAVVSHARKRLLESEGKAGQVSEKAGEWAQFVSLVVGLAYPHARLAAAGFAVAYEVAKRGLEAWGSATRGITDHIRLVSLSEARYLRFPAGHPQVDELYVGHPAGGSRYYPAWDFHRAVFEHKFSEAIMLLMALGGTRIEVHHVQGWSKQVVGTVGLETLAGAGDAQVASERSDSGELLLVAELDPSRKKPSLPRGLLWYPNEPMWQAVAQGRLNHRMRSCQMVVNYQDHFGVSANLEAQVAKLKGKLRLGGDWTKHQSTIWRIRANFDGSK